jgi:beta-lactamase regulating signal transducer with metallopeptidase domain
MLTTLSSHTALLQALGWTLLHSLWQGALIAALLFAINLFVKSSNARYVLACVAVVLMLVAPVVTFGLLYEKPDATTTFANQTVPTPNTASDVNQMNQTVPANELQMVPQGGRATDIAPTEPFWNVDWRERLAHYLPYIVFVWLLGVVLLSLRLLLQWLYAERFKRKHTKLVSAELQQHLRVLALRLRVSRSVQLLESSLVDAPTVIGFLKPVILLPTSALTGLSVQQLESLLAHELAHVRRHDYLVNILQSVVETLLFYHPAVWWVSYRIRTEREHCCDDVAVKVTGNAVVYAKALERLEHLRQQPRLALAANDGKLINRIRRLVVQPVGRRHFPTPWLVSFSMLAVMLLATGIWLYPQVAEAQTSPASLQVFDRNGNELTEEVAPHAFGMIRNELRDKLGTDFLSKNLKVYSTIDLQAQLSANEASLNAEMPPGAQMAVVGVDPSTGGILAMVGEHLQEGQKAGELNRVAQSFRLPGHSFTPLVYATAFEQAGFTQATLINDEPTAFKVNGQADFEPQNHDSLFMGSMTVRKSLDISRNIPAIKLMEETTPEAVVAKAEALGYKNMQPVWSLAIGSVETTPLQHAAAFGSFANGGIYNEPYIINRVEDTAGNLSLEMQPVSRRVWSEQTAYLTLDLMHGNAVDPGAFSLRAAIDGRYVAGKTGTTNDNQDIWFVGMTPGIVASVWIGFDDNLNLPKKIDPALTRAGDGVVGSSRQPIYIWHDFVEGALVGQPI